MKALFRCLLLGSACAVAACDGGEAPEIIDATEPDGPGVCDPATALPSNYRLIPKVSTGLVDVTTTSGTTSGTIDATAGGFMVAGDNPYIYVDLRAGMKVEINDLDARSSMAWDIALKRPSLRVNSGDSGLGGRKLAVVQATSLAEVTAAPTSGYNIDDFADANCALISLPAGEPSSAFGFWYDYDERTHVVTPKMTEVYVLERPDGSHTALRIKDYSYDNITGRYEVEWKQL